MADSVVRIGLGYVKGVREEEMRELVAARGRVDSRGSGGYYGGVADHRFGEELCAWIVLRDGAANSGSARIGRMAVDRTLRGSGVGRQVIDALEQQVVVLKLLAATQRMGAVTVQIGEETQTENLRGTSVVSTGYGASGTIFGSVGVVGPTRMDYPGTIASVAAVAKYVGEVLAER